MEIKIEGLIPVGIRKIAVEGRLYKVYLPTSEIWRKLKDEGYELEVLVKPVKEQEIIEQGKPKIKKR